MVSIFNFLPDYTADKAAPETAPRLMVGAASPLWLMFGGAAAAGATYWWWANRWREAVNLESLMALAPEPVALPLEAAPDAPPGPVLEAIAEPVIEAVALVAETVETALDATQEIVEAAVEPIVEATVAANEDTAEAVSEPVAAVEPLVAEAADAVAEAVEAAPDAIVAPLDDLTKLVGVGPKLAASLADLGVTKFSQIAAWTPDELASYDQLLNLKGRAEREAWIAQAKRFSTDA